MMDILDDWRPGYEATLRPDGLAALARPDMGLLALTGRDRQTFLQGMVSNDVLALMPGQSAHAALLDSTAHILADLYVHCREDRLLLETDSRCLARLAATLEKYLIMEKVRITDVSADWALTQIYGGASEESSRQAATDFGGFAVSRPLGQAAGAAAWLPAPAASELQTYLTDAGAVQLMPEAYNILRVEAGVPAWGSELDETILLPEAGMADAVSYHKGCYVGQEIVARIAARGHANRSLRAIVMAEGEALSKPGDKIHLPQDAAEAGREIGRVTSAVYSPRFQGRALALGYVRREHFASDTQVSVYLSQPNGAVFPAPGVVAMPGAGLTAGLLG